MNEPDLPCPRASHDPADADPSPAPATPADSNTFLGHLNRIRFGAAADGQPWPERYLLPGRRLALADADCALAGLRVVHELLLAAERTRQNRAPDQYVGDRMMEGLKMACLALGAQAGVRLQGDAQP